MTFHCPSCNAKEIGVIDTRRIKYSRYLPLAGIRRRRKCKVCGFRFSTYELTEITLHRLATDHKYQEAVKESLQAFAAGGLAQLPENMRP